MNCDDELRDILEKLVRIDQVSPALLEECLADCWHYANAEAGDLSRCTTGEYFYVHEMARRAARLLQLPDDVCLAAAQEAILRTRRQIVREVVDGYLRRIEGGRVGGRGRSQQGVENLPPPIDAGPPREPVEIVSGRRPGQ